MTTPGAADAALRVRSFCRRDRLPYGRGRPRDRCPPRRTQSGAACCRRARGQPAAHRGRRGLREDPGAHPPDRVPARRARRRAARDPGHHLHQQGGRRDGRPRRRAGRPAGAVHVGHDVPFGLRAHPAPGGETVRLPLLVLHLRPGRLAAADGAHLPRARARRQAVPAEGDGRPGVEPEERADRLRDVRLPRADRAGQGPGRGLRRVPAPAGRGRRDGLRRPDHGHGQPLPGPARGGRAVPPPVQARAGGRVPGHQPRAVHPDQGTGLRWCPALFLPNGRG